MPEYYHRTYPVERAVGGVVSQTGNYNAGGVAPHAATTRWTYTVPTNRAAQIESALVAILRTAAAAPVGTTFATVTATGVSLLYATDISNAVGAFTSQQQGESGFLNAGDVLLGQTFDGSTGGTHDLVVTAHWREIAV